jgi:hypothetical protein
MVGNIAEQRDGRQALARRLEASNPLFLCCTKSCWSADFPIDLRAFTGMLAESSKRGRALLHPTPAPNSDEREFGNKVQGYGTRSESSCLQCRSLELSLLFIRVKAAET